MILNMRIILKANPAFKKAFRHQIKNNFNLRININTKDSNQHGVNKHYKSKPIPQIVLIMYRYILPCVCVMILVCYCKYGLGLKKKINKKKILKQNEGLDV